MENIDLLKSTVKGLNYRYSAIKKINTLMGKTTDLDDFLDKVIGVVMDIIGAEAGVILLKEDESSLRVETLRAQVPYSREKKVKKEFEKIIVSVEKTGYEKLLNGTESIAVKESGDIENLSYRKAIKDTIGGLNLLSAVPVIKENRIAGVVELYNIVGSFSEETKDAFSSIGGQLGFYLELFQRLADLKTRAETLRQMVSVTESISSPSQMDAVLNMIIENSLDFFTADGCSILLKDKDGKIRFKAVSGDKATTIKDLELAKGEGIAGEVIQTGEVKLVEEAEKEESFSSRIDEITDISTGSVICAPLKVADHVTGAIEIIRKKGKRLFTEEDLGLLVILASQASITIDKARMYSQKDRWFNSTIDLLVKMINAKDEKYPENTDVVRKICKLIGEKMELESEELQHLDIAASIQNIAKLIIPDKILKKEEELSPEEWNEIRKHPVKSANILESISEFRDVIPIIKYHHEKYDGTGYPEGLAKGEIPKLARILNIADSYVAMISKRPYRKALSKKEAIENIRSHKGEQYDPAITDFFLEVVEEELKEI